MIKCIKKSGFVVFTVIVILSCIGIKTYGADTLDFSTLKTLIYEMNDESAKINQKKMTLIKGQDKLEAIQTSITTLGEEKDQLNQKALSTEGLTEEEKGQLNAVTYAINSFEVELGIWEKEIVELEGLIEDAEEALKKKAEEIEHYEQQLNLEMNTSPTLKQMFLIDYVADSMTGLSNKAEDFKTLRINQYAFGKLIGQGMPYETYKKAMSYKWKDETDYANAPVKTTINIEKNMDYDFYVNVLKKLSRYEGVYLYDIGQTTQGRRLYSIEIDLPSDKDKKVIMLTGQTHSREFAGGVFILKQLNDLLLKAQTNQNTRNLLESYKFVAVPIISLDVREGLIKEPKKWTIGKEKLWKAYANGVDGNRNYPGLQWGQVALGNSTRKAIANIPGSENYPGAYAGSNNETQALMKWFYHYVIVEQAIIHLDYHQQGRLIYAGKPWQTKEQFNKSKVLANQITKILSPTIKSYKWVSESETYGLDGNGSTATDYSTSLAVGGKFSPAYGFMTFVANGREHTLMEVKDLDTTKYKITPSNPGFASATIEIGAGLSSLGYSTSTRKVLAKEYTNYHFNQLLEKLPALIKK